MAETLVVNGSDLTANKALLIRTESGLYSTPPRRGSNIVVPGRHGELRVPYKLFGAGTIELRADVAGVDPITGLVPGGSTDLDEFRLRVDELSRLFTAETLTIDHTITATIRRAVGELAAEPIVFDPIPAVQQYGEFIAKISVPGAFWTDTTVTTSGPFALATGATATLTGFAGATAPMDELTITFGPGSNPVLSQPLTGALVAYDGVISSGRELTVDTATWTLGIGGGTSWTPDYSILRHGGSSGRLLELRPPASGGPVVQLTHSGGGTMNVTIAGRRKYLTG